MEDERQVLRCAQDDKGGCGIGTFYQQILGCAKDDRKKSKGNSGFFAALRMTKVVAELEFANSRSSAAGKDDRKKSQGNSGFFAALRMTRLLRKRMTERKTKQKQKQEQKQIQGQGKDTGQGKERSKA